MNKNKYVIFVSVFMFFVASGFIQLPALAQSPDVVFSALNANGRNGRAEGDEWVEIHNRSSEEIDLSGWSITASDGQKFDFPWNAKISANEKCKIYTNTPNAGGCAFNWGKSTAQWNNTGGDCATLLSNAGQVDQYCYDIEVAEGEILYPNNPPGQQPTQPPAGGGGGQPCPATGSWPAGCVPGGSSPAPQPAPPTGGGGGGQACPSTGSWPAGCVPDGSSPAPQPAPPTGGGQACPSTGAWPAGCVPGGSSPAPQPAPPTGGGQACPSTGAWPAGCVPGGSSPAPQPPTGGGQACPPTGAWPAGCTPASAWSTKLS